MKKIGIVTFHKSINYGSVLQTYAFCKMLIDNSYDVEVIDYQQDNYTNHYGVFKKIHCIKNLLQNFSRIPLVSEIKAQINMFHSFRICYLPISSEEYDSKYNFQKCFDNYDVIIAGSDQIWNVRTQDCDPFYFLPVPTKAKKLAYAVSINNMDFTEKRYGDYLREWLSDFNFISIREKSGQEKVKKYLDNRNVENVLDPTLLLAQSEYDEIISNRIIKENYCFLYNVWLKKDAFETAVKIGKMLGLPVYTIMVTRNYFQLRKISAAGVEVIKDKLAPQDFLSFIKYADFVISDSFHGTAFSIIFEKQFACVNEIIANGKLKNDERILNILELFDLEDRYVSEDNIRNIERKIDYSIVTPKRFQLAECSKKVLFEAIG